MTVEELVKLTETIIDLFYSEHVRCDINIEDLADEVVRIVCKKRGTTLKHHFTPYGGTMNP